MEGLSRHTEVPLSGVSMRNSARHESRWKRDARCLKARAGANVSTMWRRGGASRDVQRLLQQVVLVGGAADLPGIRPRTEFEVRQILRTPVFDALRSTLSSPDDMYILNPPMGLGEGEAETYVSLIYCFSSHVCSGDCRPHFHTFTPMGVRVQTVARVCSYN